VSQYKSKPSDITTVPAGIPYIIGNEAAERFSFYGMKTILVVFMTKYLLDSAGQPNVMNPEEAKSWFHLFSSAVYFAPIFGALIADIFWGKYKTILSLSVVYCLGHLALAIDTSKSGLAVGLALIAIGSGGIKPCVSAHVGDQFGPKNAHLISKVFGWFYFSINFGAFFSTLLTPWLLQNYGPHFAFGIPGLLMLIATILFWMGRNKFIHIPPAGKKIVSELFTTDGLALIGKLSIVYAFVAVFWSLYDQTGSSWVLQAEKMNKNIFGIELLSSQIQAVNPILILVYIPIFTFVLYPLINRIFKLTPMRKIGLGLFLTVPSFLIPAYVENLIAAGESPTIAWQILAYVIITAAEVMVSITALEFSYTQAKNSMKSIIMAFFLISVSIGNAFTSFVNYFIQNEDGTSKLPGAQYYLFFAGLMLITAFIFIPIARWYKEQTYIQEA
jgi:proton-dependent oligopeptide transporter, POT family